MGTSKQQVRRLAPARSASPTAGSEASRAKKKCWRSPGMTILIFSGWHLTRDRHDEESRVTAGLPFPSATGCNYTKNSLV